MLQQQVGDITIHRILESERPDFDAAGFFPQITPEQWAPYRQRLAGWALDPAVNGLVFPMQSFLVKTRHHTIVVDTCVGDHKERARANWNMTSSGAYLARLAEAGVRPEQVDYVMTTHFHTDHVGWNTRWDNGRWVPTFPNARYVMSEKEWAYWSAMHKETPQNQIADSVIPIVESGLAQMVKNDFALDDEVRFESTWGHTPDHMSARGDHRRSHPLPGAVSRDRLGAAARLRPQAGRGHPPRLPRPLLRAGRAGVRLALPLALLRPRGARGQRVLVRVREGLSADRS